MMSAGSLSPNDCIGPTRRVCRRYEKQIARSESRLVWHEAEGANSARERMRRRPIADGRPDGVRIEDLALELRQRPTRTTPQGLSL
jgi:hypothetical protein